MSKMLVQREDQFLRNLGFKNITALLIKRDMQQWARIRLSAIQTKSIFGKRISLDPGNQIWLFRFSQRRENWAVAPIFPKEIYQTSNIQLNGVKEKYALVRI